LKAPVRIDLGVAEELADHRAPLERSEGGGGDRRDAPTEVEERALFCSSLNLFASSFARQKASLVFGVVER